MSVRDELLIFWVCCLVLIAFFAKHLLGAAECLVQQLAALSLNGVPEMLRQFLANLR